MIKVSINVKQNPIYTLKISVFVNFKKHNKIVIGDFFCHLYIDVVTILNIFAVYKRISTLIVITNENKYY